MTYIGGYIAPFVGYYHLRGPTWQGSTDIHTIMEVVATLLALMAGISALVRYYTKRNNTSVGKPIWIQ